MRMQQSLIEEQRRAHALQEDLINEQQETRARIEKQALEAREKEEKKLERKFIQEGIVEFENDFQAEWNHVAMKFHNLASRNTRIHEILTEMFSQEFYNAIVEEKLSNSLVSQVDVLYNIDQIRSELNENHEVISQNTNKIVKWQNLGKNTNRLINVLNHYIGSELYTNGTPPKGATTPALLALGFGILGVACTSTCGSSVEVIRASFTSVVFFWPAILCAIIALIKGIRRSKFCEKQKNLNIAFNNLAKTLSGKILGTEWNSDAKVRLGKYDALIRSLRSAEKQIRDAYIQPYILENVVADSHSEGGREIYGIVTEGGEFSELDDFINALDEYTAKHEYMKLKIIEVGEEIHNGHRVPNRMKEKRIQLIRCPACGGPLAKDGATRCHYCGSDFARY